jgi:hypothetical protein
MLDTPVLFIIFNRPRATEKVFYQIKKAKPKKLFIAADGARYDFPEDIAKCEASRKIALNIDWDCQVHTRIRDINMGCGKAVSDAITWFFSKEKYGIILEDDCLPCQSFFRFCDELLKKYEHNHKVMHINGNNFEAPVNRLIAGQNPSSYYFGSFAQAWGWASWRRAWNTFDYKIPTWPFLKRRGLLKKKFPSLGTYLEKSLHFDLVYAGRVDTWDYQWQFAVLLNEGLVIIPNSNLVSNIGYGDDSTHIKVFDKTRNNLETNNLDFPIKHPPQLSPQKKLNYHYAIHMGMKPKLKNIPKYLISYFK